MKNNKKMLILLLICLLIIVIICINIIIILKRNKAPKYEIHEGEDIIRLEEEFVEVSNNSYFYTVKSIMNGFIAYIKQINGDQYLNLEKLQMTEAEATDKLQQVGIDTIKELLDRQYTEDIQTNDEKLVKYFNQYKQKGNCRENVYYSFKINEMLRKDISNEIQLVLIKSKLVNNDFNILIKIDNRNNRYSIFLEDYITKYNYNREMNEQDIKITDTEIASNPYNEYKNIIAEEEYVSIQLFNEFKNFMLNDPKTAYEIMNEEYREKKYGSYENFYKYIQENREQIEDADVKMYNSQEINGKTEYICLDAEGKYYIFTRDNVVNYRVVLDTYTIDLPEFLDKYNSNKAEIKVGLNLQKIFDAIKDKDYKYVYNKLDETFRNNNFKNEEEFERYAEQNFSDKEFKYTDCKKTNDIYVATVKITNNNGEYDQREFIVKLEEGTDFIMSFNVK